MLPMKNPAHPGELVGATLDDLGVSVSAAARSLGITRQQLHNLIAGQSAVSPEMALRLELGIGSNAETWLRMQVNHDLAHIRERAASLHVKRIEREDA